MTCPDLQALISAAVPGATVTIPACAYPATPYIGGIVKVPAVKVQAAPGAVLTGLKLLNDVGLDLIGLALSPDPKQANWQLQIQGGSDITVEQSTFKGVLGAGVGIRANGVTRLTIQHNDIGPASSGLDVVNSDQVKILANSFHDLDVDGIQSGSTNDIVIDGNTLTNFYPKPGGAHPDAIQFMTVGQTAATHDVTVTNNSYLQGLGLKAAQGIFLGNEAKLAYSNVKIAGNVIQGAIYNGISVDTVAGLSISNNLVLGTADSSGITSWIYAIRATGTVGGNVTTDMNVPVAAGLAQTGNTVVPLAAPGDLTLVNAFLAGRGVPQPPADPMAAQAYAAGQRSTAP